MSATTTTTFKPEANEELSLGGSVYRVRGLAQAGPLAKRPIRMIGGRAQVYQLIQNDTGKLHALKVMLPAFRDPQLVRNQSLLSQLAPLPGFDACKQIYLTPSSHPDELKSYPDLIYSSIMPWIDATTWTAVVSADSDIDVDENASWEIAYQFLVLARVLERNGIAHCDLSGGNVMVNLDKLTVNLIDFDEVYWSGAPNPVVLPTGTPGYRKKMESQWKSTGDRFATAVLVAEMLGWRDETVRSKSSGDSFFSDEDCATQDPERYRLLGQFLSDLHPSLGELFERAWQAPSPDKCPSIDEWRMELMWARGWDRVPLDARDRARLTLPTTAESNTAVKKATPASSTPGSTPGGTRGRVTRVPTKQPAVPGKKSWAGRVWLAILIIICVAIALYIFGFMPRY
ncbi:MAG TPA: hypothetical protein VGE45_20760 [Chloroflexia bacterium]|jgi:hypothetical protein